MVDKFQFGSTVVTGGAGFIGSHIVDKLISNDVNVKVLDNLSNGRISNLNNVKNNKNFGFLQKDLGNLDSMKNILIDVKSVFHIAAYPEVRTGFEHPEISYKENIENTFKLLEAIRKSEVENIVFSSTSTIYGEPDRIPTTEDYGPLYPISPYGASKLACEALISSYCHNYGINGLIFRFANIVGSRSNHGVIIDFIKKLRNNKTTLQVLGDGKQSKSYLYVNDCIDCFFFCLEKTNRQIDIFNIGNEDTIDVMNIAKIVCNCMKLNDVTIETVGGASGGRGWIGDVKQMQLDISKLKKLGWKPKLNSAEAVKLATMDLLEE